MIQYFKVTVRSIRRRGKWYQVVTWLLVLLIVIFPTVLWGGSEMGYWRITPDTGRPAVALLMAAVLWLGLLVHPTQ